MRNLLNKLDKRYLKTALYASVSILATFFIGRFLISLSPFIKIARNMVSAIAGPFVTGIMLSYLLYPAVGSIDNFLKKIFKKAKKTRTIAVFLLAASILFFIFLFLALLLSIVTKQISNINFKSILFMIESIEKDYKSLISSISKYLSGAGIKIPNVGSMIGRFASGTSTAFFGIIFAVYILIDGANIGAYWKKAAHKLLSDNAICSLKEWGQDLDSCFSGYIRGQIVDAALVGITVTIILSVIGMPYALAVGLIVGVGNLIPYLGPILGYAAVIAVNLIKFNPKMLIIGIIIIMVIMFIDGNIINPRLLAGTINVHPLLVIASLLAGGAIGGILGMIVAVPCGAFIRLRFEKGLKLSDHAADDEK